MIKIKKYSCFVKFRTGKGKMEFSNSVEKLMKYILLPEVTEVRIYNETLFGNKQIVLLSCKLFLDGKKI